MAPTAARRQSARRRARPDVRALVERLEAAYGRPRFINRFEPVEELVSCIMSQSSSDASSFPAFTRLRERYPDWDGLADAPVDEVAEVIRKAGLANQKARHITATLRRIREEFGAVTLEPLRAMSDDQARQWLTRLPGVGLKTASIVLCFSFARHAVPVDTHVFRVAGRLGLITVGSTEKRAHDELLALVPPDLSFRFHLALIQHGRKTCRAPRPDCANCTVTDLCAHYRGAARGQAGR